MALGDGPNFVKTCLQHLQEITEPIAFSRALNSWLSRKAFTWTTTCPTTQLEFMQLFKATRCLASLNYRSIQNIVYVFCTKDFLHWEENTCRKHLVPNIHQNPELNFSVYNSVFQHILKWKKEQPSTVDSCLKKKLCLWPSLLDQNLSATLLVHLQLLFQSWFFITYRDKKFLTLC